MSSSFIKHTVFYNDVSGILYYILADLHLSMMISLKIVGSSSKLSVRRISFRRVIIWLEWNN